MNIYPLGNWNMSARNIILIDHNTIECELKKINGTYLYNKLIFDKNSIYENNNGLFEVVGQNTYNIDLVIPEGTWIKSARNITQTKDDETKDDETKDDETKDDENKDDENKDDENKDDENKDDENKDDENKDDENKDDETVNDENKDDKTVNDETKDDETKEYEITAELKDNKGNYKFNIIKFSKNDIVSNIDGEAFIYKKIHDKILDSIPDIPKKIFQTHKNFNYMINKQKTKQSYNSWNQYKDFEYNFYTDEECEQFIKNNFDENVYKAYMKCPIPVMKADLWRYCIIYKYGGIYADADTICLRDPNIFLEKRSYMVCIPETDNIHICNWVFAAPEGSPILKSIIDLSVERILNNFEKKQHMVHYYTGPGVFRDGIQLFLEKKDLIIFSNTSLYSYAYKNYWLHVFDNPLHFENNIVKHLLSGTDKDGWKNMIKNYINS